MVRSEEVGKAEDFDAEGRCGLAAGLWFNRIVRDEFAGGCDAGVDEESAVFRLVVAGEGEGVGGVGFIGGFGG